MRGKVVIGIVILIALLFSSIGVGFSNTNPGNSAKNSTEMRDLNSGLVAYWNFDEGSGNILHDVSGNGNDGTIYGATWVNGIHGKALKFGRNNGNYVEISSSNSLKSISQAFTISGWVKIFSYPETGDHGETLLMFQEPDNGWGGSENGLIFYVSERDNNYGIRFNTGDLNDHDISYVLKRDVWYFVSVVGDNSGHIYFYVNSTKVGSDTWDYPLPLSNLENVYIGLDIDGVDGKTDFLDGTVDEVRIYNRALSPQEVKELYEQYVLKPTNPGGNGLGYLWLIIAGVVIAAVIAIALIMLRKRGGKSQPQGYYGYPPQYPPQPPPQPPQYQQAGYPPPPPPSSQGGFMNKPQPPPPQSMGMITVTCPYCGFTSQVPENMRGQWVQCPKCGNQFQVP